MHRNKQQNHQKQHGQSVINCNKQQYQQYNKYNTQSNKNITQLYGLTNVQIQRHKLKSTLLSLQITTKQYEFYSNFHIQRIQSKYTQLYTDLQKLIRQIKTQFIIAQGNELRAVNNVMKGCVKRIELVQQKSIKDKDKQKQKQKQKYIEQNSNFNNIIDEQQRWVLQQLILNPFGYQQQSIQRLSAIQQTIQTHTMRLQQHLKQQNKQSFTRSNQQQQQQQQQSILTFKMMNIVNSTCMHLYPLYEQFQAKLLTISGTLQQGFQLLDIYVSRLQGLGVRRCIQQVKTDKQVYMQRFIQQYESKKVHGNHGQSILLQQQQDNIHNIHQRVVVNNKFMKRGSNNNNNNKVLLGRMFSRKKGNINNNNIKQGIVTNNNNRDKRLLSMHNSWCYGVDGEQVIFNNKHQLNSVNDQWGRFYSYGQQQQQQQYSYKNKNNNRVSQIIQNQNNYQHQYMTIQQILTRTYPSQGDIQWFNYYDQYGGNQTFSIIHPLSNMVQNRIIFQSSYEMQVNNQLNIIHESIKQNQLKMNKYQQQSKKKQKKRQIKQKQMNQLSYNRGQQYTNNQIVNNKQTKPITIGTDQRRNEQMIEKYYNESNKTRVKQIELINNKLIDHKQQQQSFAINNNHIKQQSQHVINSNKQQQSFQLNVTTNNKQQQQQKRQDVHATTVNKPLITTTTKPLITPASYPSTLLSSIIQGYFSTISQKYTRISKQQRTLKIFYFPSIQQINWQYLHQQTYNIQRVFIVIEQPIVMLIKMERLYTLEKQLIKCVVYQYNNEGQQIMVKQQQKQMLKTKIKQQVYNQEMVTFLFKKVDIKNVQLQQQQRQLTNQQQPPPTTSLTSNNNLPSTKCLLGMLFVLIYQHNVLQKDSAYALSDYCTKGQQVIQQYQSFCSQQKQQSQMQQFMSSKVLFRKVFYQNINNNNNGNNSNTNKNKVVSRINYFFDLQSEQGVVFQKLIDVTNTIANRTDDDNDNGNDVQVFKVKRYKMDDDRDNLQQQQDDQLQRSSNDDGEQHQHGQRKQQDVMMGRELLGQQKVIGKINDQNKVAQIVANDDSKEDILNNNNTKISSLKQIQQVQQQITKCIYNNQTSMLMTIKRSNSRQQLQHFNPQQHLLFFQPSQQQQQTSLNHHQQTEQQQVQNNVTQNEQLHRQQQQNQNKLYHVDDYQQKQGYNDYDYDEEEDQYL